VTSVVVTGRGVTTSVGEEVDEMFDALLAGRSGIVDGIGPCSEFDPDPVLTPKGARRTDRFSQLGVAAADKAWAESGLSEDNVDLTRVGVLIGTGVGGLITLENECTKFLEGGERAVSPLFVTMMMPNAPAGLISMRIGARGPGFSVASACATGSHAIGEAKRIIERGEADVVVAGGCEAALTGLCLAAFKTMGALSQDGISRPFDANRTGFVMGEGAGVLILEREDHAKARGATIYGRIAGYGASSDAYHITAPDPEGRGSTAAIRLALQDAGAQPSDAGYVNAHGTGTPLNDAAETKTLHAIFNGGAPPVSSTKSHIGHLLGAAGAVEAVVCLEAVRLGVLPPTINLETADPECDLDYIPAGRREAPGIQMALSNSFGFGGQNACLAVTAA
jgi:3-oxoacyl-[acyl-carrier-protein] synthase II